MKIHNPKTLIIDDEPDAREVLRTMIGRFCPQLEICGEADSVVAALESIQRQRPELVFLDVDLHPGTGFDILDAFPNPDFKTVFTTAHDDFALKAYKYRAFHYLLKPIDPQDLIQVTKEINNAVTFKPEYELPSLSRTPQGKLLLPTLQGVMLVQTDEISYAYADEKYTQVVLSSGEKIFVSHSLKEVESLLPEGEFLRPHQSYVVRIEAIRKIHKGLGSLLLLLKDKTEIPVSRRNKDAVLRIMGIGQ
ncbi:MAG: response regulator transcription factor [Phycisphaerae bacterium]|nr:response regulator transcription factor [Saprospiraceae bacterium]